MNLKLIVWNWLQKKYRIRSRDLLVKKYRRKVNKLFFKKKYDTQELIEVMKNMGLKKGSNVFIQSSWDEFYNYTGSIHDFISAVLIEIGKEGTLAMPALPFLIRSGNIFDINRTPTQAGLIAESFRKFPGVKRSINSHSVCSIGPMSDYLLDEHQFSTTCWDLKSPYYKLSKINAIVFSFGLGKGFFGTMFHCQESILRDEIPYFLNFFQEEEIWKYRLQDNSIFEHVNLTTPVGFPRYYSLKSFNKLVSRYFDRNEYKRTRLSNLTINMAKAEYSINRVIELGRIGITAYFYPNPKGQFKK